MSNAVPGYKAKLRVSSNGGSTFVAFAEVRGFKQKRTAKMIDATSFDSNGDMEYIASLRDWTATADGLFIDADAGQQAIEAGFIAGTKLQLQYDPYGTGTGKPRYTGDCFITDMEMDSPNADLSTRNVSFQGTAAWVRTTQ